MRCPKCSFISFDQVETCARCGKNIKAAAEALQGTSASFPSPGFLKFDVDEQEAPDERDEFSSGEEIMDMSDAEEEDMVDFSLDEDSTPELDLGTEEEPLIDLGAEEETDFGTEEEPEIDLGEETIEEQASEEAIDISGLTPSEEVEAAAEETFDDMDRGEGHGLEDLHVDIELETEEAVAEVSQGGKVMPSVKTGTALDDFDIDLGDLLTRKKK